MGENIPRFQVDVVPDCDPEIGRWLGILDDARKRLQFTLRSVQESDLDAPPRYWHQYHRHNFVSYCDGRSELDL